jgi:hypothetical protein
MEREQVVKKEDGKGKRALRSMGEWYYTRQ